ncbi:MAG: hypothetical protein MMC23_006269 [Stictis urceolatum]|nr:hypothetical protein [Stictis urceolata]
MSILKTALISLLLAAAALARSVPSRLDERATCVDTCGSTCYYQSDIDAAVTQGCSDLKSGSAPDSYPHEYEDYEGFSFPDPGPWYEFPILSSYKVYTGGSPGADRVIFTKSCAFQAVITHTGASGDDFVACKKS